MEYDAVNTVTISLLRVPVAAVRPGTLTVVSPFL